MSWPESLARRFCCESIRICASKTVHHSGFVSRRIVVWLGAEFDPDEISLEAVIVVEKSFRHQVHEGLKFLLVCIAGSLGLQLLPRIMQETVNARVVLLAAGKFALPNLSMSS